MKYSEFFRQAYFFPISFAWLKPDFISKQNDIDIHYWQVDTKYGWTLHLLRFHIFFGPRNQVLRNKEGVKGGNMSDGELNLRASIINANTIRAMIRVQGMVADNSLNLQSDIPPAHTEEDFKKVIEEEGVGYNYVMEIVNGSHY
jgi:hypothetical protein